MHFAHEVCWLQHSFGTNQTLKDHEEYIYDIDLPQMALCVCMVCLLLGE